MMLAELRTDVCEGNRELRRHGLVAWTGGNLSALGPDGDCIVIKPSGLRYSRMRPRDMVVVSLSGLVLTHSRFATAFAAVGRPIPCVLIAMADEFGGPVPCGGYAQIGGDAVGEEVVRSIGRSPAVLLKQHGVFTIGASISKALQAAVMVEDVARTVITAMQLGTVQELPPEEIATNHDRYANRYGTIHASQGVSG